MGNDGWMERSAAHSAMKHFVNFLVYKHDRTKCVGIRIKETGEEIMDGDPRLKKILGDAFDNLQDACFYDFGKDMENSLST